MNLKVSEKHGVNPSIEVCDFCGRDVGVVLFGEMENDTEAPRHVNIGNLCDECKDLASKGFVLRERDGDMMTGNVWVITHDAAERLFNDPDVVKRGMAHIAPETVDFLGLREYL